MYVNLYPNKQLKATKRSTLLLGLFLAGGGTYALYREFFMLDALRLSWLLASIALVLAGALLMAFATDLLRFRDVYFSMTPERIAYRLALLGREQTLYWSKLESLEISTEAVTFRLKSGKKQLLRLGAIQQEDLARHVARSLHLAALEKGLRVNGTKPSPQEPALQV